MTYLDETNVCYLCEITHDCADGNEVKALSGEWVCLSCQDKLVIELAAKWVSVDDRLPIENVDGTAYATKTVLATDGEYVHEMLFAAGIAPKPWSEWSAYGDIEPSRITHWMPLPSPPKANELEGGE